MFFSRRRLRLLIATATTPALLLTSTAPVSASGSLLASSRTEALLPIIEPLGSITAPLSSAFDGMSNAVGLPLASTSMFSSGPPARFVDNLTFVKPNNKRVDDCVPSAVRPFPVILIHGTFGNRDAMGTTIGQRIAARGFCVVSETFGAFSTNPKKGGVASIKDVSSYQLRDLIDQVMRETGAPKVDLVGFSQGAAIAGYVAKKYRSSKVNRVVSMAGYWGADASSLIPAGVPADQAEEVLRNTSMDSIADLLDNTAMMKYWYAPNNTPFADGIKYTLIASEHDPVMPPKLSFVYGPNTQIINVQDGCPENKVNHDRIPVDGRVADMVLNALDQVQKVQVRCP